MFQFLLQLLKGNNVATHFSYSLLYICLAAVVCNSLPLQSHIIPLISQVTIQLFRNPVLICHIGWLRIFQIFLPGISGSLEFKQTDRESVCVARLAKYLSQHPSSKAQWKQQNKWANMALWGEGKWERLCKVIHWLIKCPVTEINHYIKYVTITAYLESHILSVYIISSFYVNVLMVSNLELIIFVSFSMQAVIVPSRLFTFLFIVCYCLLPLMWSLKKRFQKKYCVKCLNTVGLSTGQGRLLSGDHKPQAKAPDLTSTCAQSLSVSPSVSLSLSSPHVPIKLCYPRSHISLLSVAFCVFFTGGHRPTRGINRERNEGKVGERGEGKE